MHYSDEPINGFLAIEHQQELHSIYFPKDGDFKGLGQAIVAFCRTNPDWEQFKDSCQKIVWTEQAPEEPYNYETILPEIYEGKYDALQDFSVLHPSIKDMNHGYVLNLDTHQLEFYDGYTQHPKRNIPLNFLTEYPLDNIPNLWNFMYPIRPNRERDTIEPTL